MKIGWGIQNCDRPEWNKNTKDVPYDVADNIFQNILFFKTLYYIISYYIILYQQKKSDVAWIKRPERETNS